MKEKLRSEIEEKYKWDLRLFSRYLDSLSKFVIFAETND